MFRYKEEIEDIEGFEREDDYNLYVSEGDFEMSLCKIEGKIYAEIQEEEPVLVSSDGRLFLGGELWYMPFDYDKFKEAKDKGELGDMYYTDFELYE